MDAVTAFAPATVSNVACGYDVLGFALTAPGDEVTARFADGGVRIDDITGDRGRLPRDAAKNTASVAAQALLTLLGERRGVALTIRKGLPLSSGLGGSAASAVAAVVAVDGLLGARTPLDTLMACAFEGERIGAGSAHGDNIGPAVYGGFVLVRVPNPPDVIRLPVPSGLTAVVVHPDLEIETAKARTLLGHDGAARRRDPPVGQPRRARGRAAPRRFRAALALARGHDRRAAPRLARPRARGDQAGRRRRRRSRLQPVRLGAVAVRAVPRRRRRAGGRRGDDGRRHSAHRRGAADLRVADRPARRARRLPRVMRFLTTRGSAPPVSFTEALFEGLAPDGGLYVPETVEPWTADELSRLPRRTLTEIGLRALRPFTRGEIDPATLEAVVVEALNFEIPLVEVEPGLFALELFHGPTFAFKDVGARVMARLMAALHRGAEPLTVLAATSGDTGSAVAYAFHRVPNTRVVILYPDGRVSPTQEAQLTMFNGERGNVRAYAVAGSFDDCHRLTRDAFGDADLRRRMRLTSANSVNVGRLLPQSVYYFHAVGQVGQQVGQARSRDRVLDAERQFRQPDRRPSGEARRPADLAVRRRDQRERRRAGVPRDRAVRAAVLRLDARQCDGRRPPEQLRTDDMAV